MLTTAICSFSMSMSIGILLSCLWALFVYSLLFFYFFFCYRWLFISCCFCAHILWIEKSKINKMNAKRNHLKWHTSKFSGVYYLHKVIVRHYRIGRIGSDWVELDQIGTNWILNRSVVQLRIFSKFTHVEVFSVLFFF